VKSAEEILQTLDADGTLERLPFMPEMTEFCGRRFQVSKRVVKTCYYTKGGSAGMRKFEADDVVLLDGLRCSGVAHDGCQKACKIVWREGWLRRVAAGIPFNTVSAPENQPRAGSAAVERLQTRLKTMSGPKTYFCQASEILNATQDLSRWERFGKC